MMVSANKGQPQIPNQKKVWTTSEIKNLSVYEYEKVSAEIDAAYREGRVIRR